MPRRPRVALLVSLLFLLGGSLDEQRGRLPSPERACADPIEGVWFSHVHFPHVGEWYRYTLTVERDGADGALKGEIEADFWAGEPSVSAPIPCDGGYRRGITSPAKGRVEGSTLSFEGTSWAWDPAHPCAADARGDYLLDRFSGTVDLDTLEFQAVLNADSPIWTDVPILFRRISCGDEPQPIAVPPPPPARQDRGWGCW